MSERIRNLTFKRKPITFLNDFEEYWSKHTPDAHDLADEFGISARQVRDLWQQGVLTKGASLDAQLEEWDDYQSSLHGNARKSSVTHRRG